VKTISDADFDSEVIENSTLIVGTDPVILRERRVVAQRERTFESDVFKLLRTKILKQLKGNNWHSFGITAPTQGAGKSMVAVNLAIAIAMEIDESVLLVDMDLIYPKINWYFNRNLQYGLKDHILSNIPLADILFYPGIEGLSVLPGRGQTISSSEIISGPKMRHLIKDIKNENHSRVIIFDLPPVLAADDVLASMVYYDAILLIVEEGVSTPGEVKKSLQMLSGIPLLGTVLNKSENMPDHQRYYKKDKYYTH
jgi:Mrp family chromosome partitioning ATPase